MIDLSKWDQYTPEQKKKKIPWIILLIVIWIVIFIEWILGTMS